jgi:GNAT superfamily N-acetyltransferase
MQIRLMTAADVGPVAELAGQLGYPSTSAQVAVRFELLRERPQEGLFVAVDGQSVVGWVHVGRMLTLESDPCAEIAGLVVDAACHGRGVGRALVEAAEAWAAEHGFTEVRVRSNVVRDGAHRFYQRLGYEIVKTQVNFRRRL